MLKHSRLSPSKRLAKDGEGVFWSVTPTWNAGGGRENNLSEEDFQRGSMFGVINPPRRARGERRLGLIKRSVREIKVKNQS